MGKFPILFSFLKRKLSPYRACGVVGLSPTVLKEKREDGKAIGERRDVEKTSPLRGAKEAF